MLRHLYRLRELCKTRLADFEQQIESQAPALKPERGATWARNCDTQWLFRLPSPGLAPVYAETYGAVYGELLWRPRIELPLAPDRLRVLPTVRHHRRVANRGGAVKPLPDEG